MSRKPSDQGLPGAEPYPSELEDRMREALKLLGPTYVPRTQHTRADGAPRYTNRLIFETSPYLIQHAHNPVNWYPWGDEAFRVARELNRPVLLSVGYSTCHWCHVMEVESFEDEEIAAYINAHYVAIKVDREERPDVDSVYMAAVQLMNQGGGGWPMTVVMTPEKKPFFGGTYFPARDGQRGSRMGFFTILQKLRQAFNEDPESVKNSAEHVAASLQQQSQPDLPQGIPGKETLVDAARVLAGRFDPRYGGFGIAPKFPRPTLFEFLLRYHRRTGDENALYIVTHSLDQMIAGGIYDQIGGGFHRYSTDPQWLVPHFEKMLYDNAQLISLLAELVQLTGDASYRQALVETLEYVRREMTTPEGGFYSATDADSEGHEGVFFVWTPEQIDAVLGEERGKIVSAAYGVTRYGNFEGKNILHRMRPAAEVAAELGISEAELEKTIAEAKTILYQAREKRAHPLLDDKVLTEWNAQMISAFAKSSMALDQPQYLEHAVRAAELILSKLKKDGRLIRAYRAGRAQHAAVLEDYAFATAAFLDLFEAGSDPRWLEEAIALESVVERHFLDRKNGGFFATADDAETMLVREKVTYDGAQPAGNSVAVMNLLRLAEFTTKPAYREAAESALKAFGAVLERGAMQSPKLIQALDFYLDEPKEVAIVSAPNDDGAALAKVFADSFVPNRVYVRVEEGPKLDALVKYIPWLENKKALQGKATAYVCRAQVCDAPTSDPAVFRKQLEKSTPLPMSRKLVIPR